MRSKFIKIMAIVPHGVLASKLAEDGLREGYTYIATVNETQGTIKLDSLGFNWTRSYLLAAFNNTVTYERGENTETPQVNSGPFARPLLTAQYLRDVWREQALAFSPMEATAVVNELKAQAKAGLFNA